MLGTHTMGVLILRPRLITTTFMTTKHSNITKVVVKRKIAKSRARHSNCMQKVKIFLISKFSVTLLKCA
jgi:hypothetical protein